MKSIARKPDKSVAALIEGSAKLLAREIVVCGSVFDLATEQRTHVLGWNRELFAISGDGALDFLTVALRATGKMMEGTKDLTRYLRRGWTLPSRERKNAVRLLLDALEHQRPSRHEAIWIHEGEVLRGKVVPHPDALRLRQRNADLSGLEPADVFDSPFAPLAIESVDAPTGEFPLGLPLVWGSIDLARLEGNRFWSASSYGGIFGSGVHSSAECHLIARSEGCERIGVRMANATVDTSAGKKVPRKRFSWFHPSKKGDADAWCPAVDMLTGEQALLPMEAIGLSPLSQKLYGPTVHREPFYSGAASHSNERECIVSGAKEIMLRDAYMFAWYRQRALTEITDFESSSKLSAQLCEYFARHGFALRAFDLTFDHPFAMALVHIVATRQRGNWPEGGVMAIPGAADNWISALEHALRIASAQVVSYGFAASPEKNVEDPDAVKKLARRLPFWSGVAHYLRPANAPKLLATFARSGATARVSATPVFTGDALERIVASCRSRSYDWFVADLTTPEATLLGFVVKKSIFPDLLLLRPQSAPFPKSAKRTTMSFGDTIGACTRAPSPLY